MVEKKPVTWLGLVKITKGHNPSLHLGKIMKMAAGEWKKVKSGSHEKYSQGKSTPGTRKKRKKSKKSKKCKKNDDEDSEEEENENNEEHHSSRKTRKTKCSGCKRYKKEIKKLKEKIAHLE